MRKTGCLSAALIALALAASGAATPSDVELLACGHLEELAAAKHALQEGRTEQALQHLKKADELLSLCQPEQQALDRERDLASASNRVLDIGGAGAPPMSRI